MSIQDRNARSGRTANTGGKKRENPVSLRNRGSADAVIHKAELIIYKAEPVPLGMHPRYLPSTHQYDVTVLPSQSRVPIEMSQVIPTRSADRFQITFVLGRDKAQTSPWGQASIKWLTDDRTRTKITHIKTEAALRLEFDEGRY